MTQSAKTPPEVPRNRPTVPGSLTAVAERLDSIEEGQKEVMARIEHVITMLKETLAMATGVHQMQIDVNSRLATAEANIEILMQWKRRHERNGVDSK